MTTKVSAAGLLLTKDLLGDVDEVEIHREHNRIVITPVTAKDSILELGRQPVTTDVEDASVNHDAYLHN